MSWVSLLVIETYINKKTCKCQVFYGKFSALGAKVLLLGCKPRCATGHAGLMEKKAKKNPHLSVRAPRLGSCYWFMNSHNALDMNLGIAFPVSVVYASLFGAPSR